MTDDNVLPLALADCREDEVMSLIEEQLEAGQPVNDIVGRCNQGMAMLGERFATGDCFVPELMFGGMIMKRVMEKLAPKIDQSAAAEPIGRAVIGSVRHDVHDIGKDILIMMLRGVGFEVNDLGVDVPPEQFVEAIQQTKPEIVGMSVLLTTCYESVTETVKAIESAGLRDKVSIMVGGAAASELLAQHSGCDYYGKTAVDGMKHAQQVVA